MKINIKCPCCNAVNTLDITSLSCRRCAEDLSLLYKIKAYSYKSRLYFIESLIQKPDLAENNWMKSALELSKGD